MEIQRKIREKMLSEGLVPEFIEDFLIKVEKVKMGETGKVDWSSIQELNLDDEIELNLIQNKYKPNYENLSKLAIIKLNGGLGTTMGLSSAKTLIKIKDNYSFLQIIAKQIEYVRNKYNIHIPLILMDSFNTQKDSQNELKKIKFPQKLPLSFLQNKIPRLNKEDLSPITLSDPREEWCPPGHGDIYLALKETNILHDLIQNGYKYAFISNGDNLGATIEPQILEYLIQENIEFAIEMTPKTLADIKGGVLYRKITPNRSYIDLLESAQVPDEYISEFTNIQKFQFFNTNNIWLNLIALEQKLKVHPLDLSLIVNTKVIEGKSIIQIETAMGSAINNFKNVKAIIIPRDRFSPVKKCEDYLVRKSNTYTLNEDFSLTIHPERKSLKLDELVVQLDERYYKNISDFHEYFLVYPDLLKCKSLKIIGPVVFDVPISLVGDVVIVNEKTEQVQISSLTTKVIVDKAIYI